MENGTDVNELYPTETNILTDSEVVASFEQALEMLKGAIKMDNKVNKITEEMSIINRSIEDIEQLLNKKENLQDYDKAMQLLKENKKLRNNYDKKLNEVVEIEDKLSVLKVEIQETIKNI